jgi:(R,R)-butanediol dehydrogenase/meso-butanediol dehydrogenase/diacetyl reductase
VATDAFVDAAGAPNILSDVVRMAKTHARMVVTAVYFEPVPLDLASMLANEMTLTTAMGYPSEMPKVLAALPRVRERAAGIISHRVPFDRVLHAFDLAGTAASAKVMVEFAE